MQEEPLLGFNSEETEEDYRRRQAVKAKRRQQRRNQRLILLGAFGLAAILLIVGVIMIFRAIFGGGKEKTPPPTPVDPAAITFEAPTSEPAPILPHPVAPDPTAWNLQLVNAQHLLSPTHEIPVDQLGSIVQDGVAYYFDARIVEQLQAMMNDCNANEGYSLKITSGYRGPSNQNKRYNDLVASLKAQGMSEAEADIMARQIEPPSGGSEHQVGLAVDFITGTVAEPSQAFAETPEYQWLIANAANYGFILRYTAEKEPITGVLAQPYHFRYVGVDDAHAITGAGISLEEYLMATSPAAEPDKLPAESGSTEG